MREPVGEGTLNFGQQSSLPFAGRFPGTCGEECLLKCRQYYLLGILFYHNLLLFNFRLLDSNYCDFHNSATPGCQSNFFFFFQVWRKEIGREHV